MNKEQIKKEVIEEIEEDENYYMGIYIDENTDREENQDKINKTAGDYLKKAIDKTLEKAEKEKENIVKEAERIIITPYLTEDQKVNELRKLK